MKETIKKQFIEYLLQSNDAKSSLECANFLNISSRKAKDEMKELNLELCNYGAEIKSKSGRGNGYRLVVNDENKFNYYFNEVLVENIVFDKKCFDDQESRINYIINQFLVTKGYLKMEDLATDLCISLSQLKKDMVIVKKLLNKYHLVLNHKPYYGMILEGSELDCRLCIAKHIQYNLENDNLTVYSNNQDFSQQLIIIQNILMKNSKAFDYELSDMTCKNLVSHLFVAMNRSIRNDKIKFDDKIKESIKNESTFALAAKIIKDINAEFNTALNDDEVYYCTIHLCGKRIVEDSFLFDKSILECLDEIVDTIYIKYGLDFRDNLDLKTMMGLHLIPMLSRIRYKLILKNPLIKEIKTNFILAYDLAVSASSIINKRFECEISDDEISYFALHFKLAMSENKKKKNILIVCSTGGGSAKLLEMQFKEKFMNSINMIDLCNVFELDNLDETQYDYIFSTVPISKAMKRPVIQISSFLNFENQKIINTALNMSNSHFDFLQYFKKELFITQIDAANQQEVIKCMTHHVRKYEKIEDDFEMSVLKREEMAATNFGYMVAMPHPIKLNTHQTFICVGILKKPIYWQERNKVQVIFLSSFTKGFAKHNDQFFVTLSKLIESKPLIDQLIQKPSYETFTEIVKSINQEELYD